MTRWPSKSQRTGFTLLEIMLAVAVLALVTISIFRFVDTTLAGVRLSTEQQVEEGLDDAFDRFFRAQMNGLLIRQESLIGEPHLFNQTAMDEMSWYALPGFGSLTGHARGEQRVTLMVRDAKENGPLEIGLRRQDAEAREAERWTPLLSGVKALEIRYYQSSTNEWLEKWTDGLTRPALVRLRYWRGKLPDPVEITVALPPLSSEALSTQLMQNSGMQNAFQQGGSGGRPPGGPGGSRGPEGNPPGRGEGGRGGRGGQGEGRGNGGGGRQGGGNRPPGPSGSSQMPPRGPQMSPGGPR